MMIIASAMVLISPFQALWDNECSDPGDCCIHNRVRDGLTIRRVWKRLIVNGVNLTASACKSQFRFHSRKGAAMRQQIGGGCYSQEYDSSTCDGVKIGGVVVEKFASLFHILSKIHTVSLVKIPFSRGKSCGSDEWKNLTIENLQ